MSEKERNTILRFAIIFLIILAGFLAVVIKIAVIQYVERDKWMPLAKNQIKDNQPVPATRGNILDCRNRLLAGSMPQYYINMDTRVEALHLGGDTLFNHNVNQFAQDLSRIIGDQSAAEYKAKMVNSFHTPHKKGYSGSVIRLSPRRINFIQKKQLEQLPFVKRGRIRSGVMFDEVHRRIKPYGELASRTIGSIYGESGVGNAGLEKRFDKELRGVDGVSKRQKIGGRYENVVVREPEDGVDILTTLDANLLDITTDALRDKLTDVSADWGCCILMETQSGKVRAMVNLDRTSDGSYVEMMNHAVQRVEPGSTFKTIALVAAMDDGLIGLYDTISVSKEPWRYFSSRHSDAHPKDTVLTTRSALAISSNIALAKIITKSYKGSARKFVRKLEKMGLKDSMYCEIPGYEQARIDIPNDTVTLSKMSYGYSVELSPLQIITFYNAIANDGKMIRPYMVSEIQQNGDAVQRFGTEVLNNKICNDETLRNIRLCLHDVVWDNHLGTASVRLWKGKIADYKAQSELVHIAGKTGTAQLFRNGGYSGRNHRMTFVGYFPEEDPQYTCLCMIENPKNLGLYDAGYDCGNVVRVIAEKTIAYSDYYTYEGDSLVLKLRDNDIK